MKKFSKILIAAVLAVFLVAGSSWATAMLDISGTGFTSFQISDMNGDGIADWSGAIGAFEFAFAAGTTKPQVSDASVPKMHLGGYATTKSGGTFTVMFSDTDFGPLASEVHSFISSMNGLGGTQSLEVYYDTSNTIFGKGIQIADIDILNTDEIFNGIPGSDPFSLTMITTITLGAGGVGSFDNGVNAPVPEPASILLLGGGLLAMAGVIRKKMLKS